MKSSPGYFYVQRNTNFGTKNVAIPFELERLNVGGAMNAGSGIFTAPLPGIYFFTFSGRPDNGDLTVGLYLNGNLIGSGRSIEDYETFTLQSTLSLYARDQVSVRISSGTGSLYDDSFHFTHFNGWLLQEDLSY